MPAIGSPLFLSYSSADQERAEHIAALLRSGGVEVWVDRDGIAAGASYGSEIATAIRQAPIFLLCVTPAALASRNVRQEIAIAWKHERPIIPLLLEAVEIPAELEYWLEATQWIEIFERDEHEWMPRLTAALEGYGVEVEPTQPGERMASPPTPAVQLPTNLPLLPLSVVGREDDIREIVQLLRSGTKLLTLTGPGGVGKTTLAVVVAQELIGDFPDGVFFVDLSPVRSTSMTTSTIAQAMGIRELGIETQPSDLAVHLHGKRVLLLIDNTEHLAGCELVINDLLTGAPETTALVTSRRPLHLRGERERPVGALPLADGHIDISEIAASAAVQLFVERASQAVPGFALNDSNGSDIAAICNRLDGLPLALELAGARLRLFSTSQLLTRLEQDSSVLTGGVANAPNRQRALKETVAWSVELLSPAEQALFRRLAVFVGGCTFEAAEAVTTELTAEFPHRIDLIGGLDTLVDNSLLKRRQTIDGQIRFEMLSTILDTAKAILEESGEGDQIRLRHAEWCQEYAHKIVNTIERDFSTLPGIRRVAEELPNFRAALAWLERTGNDVLYKWIAANLTIFWTMFDGKEIRDILLRAPCRDDTLDPALRAKFLGSLLEFPENWLPAIADQHAKSIELQRLCHDLGDRYQEAFAHFQESEFFGGVNDWNGAHDKIDIAIEMWESIGQKDWQAIATLRKAAFFFYAGDVESARVWGATAMSLYDREDGRVGTVPSFESVFERQWRAVLEATLGEGERGAALLVAALQTVREIGSITLLADWVGAACCFLAMLGDELGWRLIEEVIRIQDAMGYYHQFLVADPRRIKGLAPAPAAVLSVPSGPPLTVDEIVVQLGGHLLTLRDRAA